MVVSDETCGTVMAVQPNIPLPLLSRKRDRIAGSQLFSYCGGNKS